MPEAALKLAGWGRNSAAVSATTRPERFAEALANFAAPVGEHGRCLVGAQRSYGDCAVNGGGGALMTTRLDRVMGFDAATGIVQAEPGVTFQRLLEAFLPRGFLVPVTPGTAFATIGGAVANDVHGKNHEHAGSFGQHVVEIDLALPDGGTRTITPADGDVFAATVAGLGLTGFMTRIALRMARVPGDSVHVSQTRVASLDDFLAAMQNQAASTYSVGWIDGTARGAALGRGILETAEHAEGNFTHRKTRSASVPVDFPGFALNAMSVGFFNELYYRRVPAGGRRHTAPLAKFLYPLDALHGWNRIYGKGGFHQFQCVVPYETGPRALRDLLEVISHSGRASFLAVLKRMGPGRAGMLSFPMAGYTLALDFPNKPGIEALYSSLCDMTLQAGGRVYLAKDALLSRPQFRAMYPEFSRFQQVISQLDPMGRLQSGMSRRLGLHSAS